MEAGRQVKEFGLKNDLLERIKNDADFSLNDEEMKDILTPEKYIGRSVNQVEEFVSEYIKPIICSEEKYTGSKEMKV